eukprot:3929807-Amphidinium_carterae.1
MSIWELARAASASRALCKRGIAGSHAHKFSGLSQMNWRQRQRHGWNHVLNRRKHRFRVCFDCLFLS